jgi:hypothetical protein
MENANIAVIIKALFVLIPKTSLRKLAINPINPKITTAII